MNKRQVQELGRKLERLDEILSLRNEDEELIVQKTQQIDLELKRRGSFIHSNTSKLFIATLIITRTYPNVRRVLTFEQLFLLFKKNVPGLLPKKTVNDLLNILDFRYTNHRFNMNDYFVYYGKIISEIPELTFKEILHPEMLYSVLEKMWTKFVNIKNINVSSTYKANKFRTVLPAILSFLQVINLELRSEYPELDIQIIETFSLVKMIQEKFQEFPFLNKQINSRYIRTKEGILILEY